MSATTHILQRKSITDILRQAVNRHCLVTLTAPMGYGKTTAARELLRHLGHRVFYIFVNPGPHNAFYLWARACGQLAAQGSPIAPLLRARGFPMEANAMQRAFDEGRKYLDGRPTLLVIDDYHYVVSRAVDDFLEAMVREEMPGLCIMLLSRTKPGLPLVDLSLKGLAAVFDKELLTFSQEEAEELFRLHGIRNKGTADNAWAYSEGWAAALWLGLQSYKTHGALAPDHSVDNLLESAVYGRYSDDERLLLLQLSPLSSFTPGQAAAVSGNPCAPLRLAELHAKNAFLNYSPGTDIYSLHSLFRNFLLNHLRDDSNPLSGSIDRASLYRRMGQWHAAEGEVVEAIKAFAKAGDDEDFLACLKIFEKPNDGVQVMYDPTTLLGIFTSIPWQVRDQCPIGYLGFLYHYMTRVSLEQGLPLLSEAERRFLAEPCIPDEVKRQIEGECILIRGAEAFNDLFAMRDIHENAYRLLRGRSSIAHRHLIWSFGCPHVVFLYLQEPGSYRRLVELVEANLHFFQSLADGCAMGAQHLFRAEFLLERGLFKQVEAHIMRAIYRAASKEQRTTMLAANFTLARLFLATGQTPRLMSMLSDMDPEYFTGGSPLLLTAFESGLGYLYACLERPEDIPRWLREGKVSVSAGLYQGAAFPRVLHGKYLLLKKDWLRLETYAQDLPSLLGGYSHLFVDMHAAVLEAVAVYHLDGVESGAEILQKALALARPDGITLSLAEYGRALLPLLRHILATDPSDSFVKDVTDLAQRYGRCVAGSRQDGASSAVLKDRERLLLDLVSQGKSNSEIAGHLKISEAAVKKSFSGIYRKLGVKGRAEAVRVFKELE